MIPSDTGHRRSSRLAGVKPISGIPNYTKSGVEQVWKGAHEKNISSFVGEALERKSQDPLHKSFEDPRPVIPHSTLMSSSHPISSFELGDEFEASSYPYHHGTRTPNKEDFKRTKNSRLDLPATGEKKRWVELNAILSDVLPRKFSRTWISSTPSSDIASRFDTFLFEFFKENCGIVEPVESKPQVNNSSKHKGLSCLRLKKQQCKKARKDLLKRGFDKSSAPVLAITGVWKKLLRAHNKLRRAVKYKQAARAKKFAKRQFLKDRVKFAKKLFSDQKKSGNPTFSKEEGDAYFKKLYHDDVREAEFSPLEGMERPPPPEHGFEMRPPSFRDFGEAP